MGAGASSAGPAYCERCHCLCDNPLKDHRRRRPAGSSGPPSLLCKDCFARVSKGPKGGSEGARRTPQADSHFTQVGRASRRAPLKTGPHSVAQARPAGEGGAVMGTPMRSLAVPPLPVRTSPLSAATRPCGVPSAPPRGPPPHSPYPPAARSNGQNVYGVSPHHQHTPPPAQYGPASPPHRVPALAAVPVAAMAAPGPGRQAVIMGTPAGQWSTPSHRCYPPSMLGVTTRNQINLPAVQSGSGNKAAAAAKQRRALAQQQQRRW